MKYKILIYTVLSLVACALSAQVVTDRKVMWDYPVKSGMEGWEKCNKSIDGL
jgi:carbonic anhydrase